MFKIKPILFILFFHISISSIVSQTTEIKINCDPQTGLCTIPEFSDQSIEPIDWKTDSEIIYIGDPMCSWCWGISPQLNALQRYGKQAQIPFSMVMGGLRPGGGEEWNEPFKNFLKHHWEEVNKRSGQPFGYQLFELDNFNYDTEPACRAIVTVRNIAPEKVLPFYELTQHYFYVASQDPKQVAFYQPICEKLDINFEEFANKFTSQAMKQATITDFRQSRQWGVNGFPAVLFRKGNQLHFIGRGYTDYEGMKERLEKIGSE